MRRQSSGVALAVGVAGLSLVYAADARKIGEWPYYSADNRSSKYSPLDQINKDTVAKLQVAWRRPQVDPSLLVANPDLRLSNRFTATPIMVNGVLYVPDGLGLVEAIDPGTGRTLWTQQPLVPGADGLLGGGAHWGVAYWSPGGPASPDARIFTTRAQFLFALDPKSGAPLAGFGDGGKVDLNVGLGPLMRSFRWSGVPLVVRDVVVIGSSMLEQDSARTREGAPGDVRAYDVRTGRLRWTFHVIPHAGEPGAETWENDSNAYTGAGNVWSMMSADDDLGYVYLPTSGGTNDMYGGHRLGNNLYTSSIVCLDARTGKRVWHFQTVHHDLFDYDNPAAPILVDITVGGRRIKAVAQVTKHGFVFVLDRITGKPVWPIEERPVPASDVVGERASRTQPFPTKPPPFERQGLQEDDLIDFTAELRAEALEILKQYRVGPLFTPPSVRGDAPAATKGTLQLPGSNGGTAWTGAAFDPDTNTLFIPSKTNPFAADLVKGKPEETNLDYRAAARPLVPGPRGLPLVKPPYGRVTAIDLNRGDRLWMVANGDGPRNHPEIKALNLPPLGQAVRSAAIATRSLLFVTEGDQINPRTPPGGGGRKLRALDKTTGQTVSEIELDAGATGAPMTYLFNGKQFIVLAIGGQRHPGELVALSLP
ncbi:MAG: pyrroloquinoline quinone-dependent dehydrogenase [Acidobacteriota bacterium]